jgi:type II secretory pathway pseudopilin PulG
VTDIDKLSEDQADAMVSAMIASWKRSIDEVDRLRAENQRLRAIEAAAREVAANVEDDSDSLLGCVVVQPSREEWLALKAALAAKDML